MQKLLRRWWYAITWPDPACAGNVSRRVPAWLGRPISLPASHHDCNNKPPSLMTNNQPPRDYESLEGYPGLFVCVRGDQIGHVLDRRNMADCPNFNNLSKKPAALLKVRCCFGAALLWRVLHWIEVSCTKD